MTMRRRRVLSKLSNTRKSIAPNIAAWKRHGLRLASSWTKSTTASVYIRRSVIVRRWSSSAICSAPKRWGEDEHEFSEAWGIYQSDEVGSTGSKRSGSLPVPIGFDEFQPAIPSQVALQQSLPPLRRPRPILQNPIPPYNDFPANGDHPLNSVSQPKGSLHSNPLSPGRRGGHPTP